MFCRKVLFFMLFGLVGNLFANGFIGETVEMSLNEHEYYHENTSNYSNVIKSSNGIYLLVQYTTGTWSEGNLRYHLVKINLDTGLKTELQTSSSGRNFDLVGISDDGNKIIYKRNMGDGYGNFYRYVVDINHEENILIGPNENSPDRQSYFGNTDSTCKYFTVMSFAKNWGSNVSFGHRYYRDIESSKTIMIDRGLNGTEANSTPYQFEKYDHYYHVGSRYVIYESSASNLVTNDNNGVIDIFLYNIDSNSTIRISKDENGNEFSNSTRILSSNGVEVLFGEYGSGNTNVIRIYKYNIASKNVTLWINESFNNIRVSKDLNRILHYGFKDNVLAIRVYDKRLDKDIVVYDGFVSNAMQDYMRFKDVKGSQIVYIYDSKIVKQSFEFPKVININAGPDQNTTIGQQVRLSASLNGDSDANITSYVWKEGDVVLSTDVNFTKSDFTVGTHTITLTVTDDANNSASDDVLVNVSWSQEAVADIYLPTTVTGTVQANVEKAYRFTLYDKATLVVDAGETTDVALRGYLYDENGTQVSSMADWSKGKNNQLKIEKTLEAGVYVLKVWAGADGMFSMDVKTYVVDPEMPWSVVVKNQYTIHKNKLFTKTFSIQKNIHDANYSNLSVSVAGSANVRVDVQKKDDKGEDLEEYKYKLVGTLASSEDITLSITDNTESYSVSLPVHLKVGEFAITNVGPSNPFIIANGDDITYPLSLVFDAVVPQGSTVEPRCSFSIPWNGGVSTIYLPAIQIGSNTQRYKCSLYNVDDNHPYYFAPIAQVNKLSVDIGFDDTDIPYKTVTAPVFKRDILTAKATLEYMHEYEAQAAGTPTPPYVIVNKRYYSGNAIPKIIYLGGEVARHGVRKFNKDTVFLEGGIWKLTYGGHEVIIETRIQQLGGLTSVASQLAFTVDGSSDVTENSDVVKFIIDPKSTYRMFVKKSSFLTNMRQSLTSGTLWNVARGGVSIRECEISNSPLSASQALDFENHPCIDISNDTSTFAGVRGTTFSIEKKKDSPVSFHLFEGEIEVSSSVSENNITLYDMESLTVGENTKTKLDTKALSPLQAQYLADTSLATMDENTSVGSITITSNLSNASYILVGDNVQVGNGKISVFEGVVEGNYKLEFLPVLGYAKPESIHITLSKASLEKSYSVVYKVDTDNDGTPDSLDAFPNNSGESVDTDHDGIGNNADTDDDNDGFLDANDDLPLNPNEQTDTDHDGTGNNADTDDDNDGISDTQEIANGLNPLNASDAQADLDHDGFSNAIEISIGTDIRNAKSKPVWAPIMMGDIITFVPVRK